MAGAAWGRKLTAALWLVAVALTASACGGSAAASDSRSGKAVTAATKTVDLSVRSQKPVAHSVVIDEVKLDAPGYAGVYADGNGAPGQLVGSSVLLSKGDHRDVKVSIASSMSGKDVFVVLHHEDNGNKKLDFPSADAPVQGSAGVVLVKLPLR